MDSAWVSGTQNPGSIPGEATKVILCTPLDAGVFAFYPLCISVIFGGTVQNAVGFLYV